MATFDIKITSEKLKKLQNDFINKSYKSNNISKRSETIDIINDYSWINDKAIKSKSSLTLGDDNKTSISNLNVPFCYVVERKSALNAGIANLINTLQSAGASVDKGIDEIANTVDSFVEAASDSPSTAGTTFKKVTKGAADALKGLLELLIPADAKKLLELNNLNSGLFTPYRYLYITKDTGKKYVFPMASNSSSLGSLKSNWGNENKLPNFLQKGIDWVDKAADFISRGTNLISNFNAFTSGEGGDTNYAREMAKSFSYPQNGDVVTVQFTLYNTVKLNSWKENYKFLFLFFLRNLPMRIDYSSFTPPLLYDIIIPGVKRLPVCAVSYLNVAPRGMTRVLTCENFLGLNGDELSSLVVNVPEAWEVTIQFSSLIATSMNLILGATYGDLQIETEFDDISIEDDLNTATNQ